MGGVHNSYSALWGSKGRAQVPRVCGVFTFTVAGIHCVLESAPLDPSSAWVGSHDGCSPYTAFTVRARMTFGTLFKAMGQGLGPTGARISTQDLSAGLSEFVHVSSEVAKTGAKGALAATACVGAAAAAGFAYIYHQPFQSQEERMAGNEVHTVGGAVNFAVSEWAAKPKKRVEQWHRTRVATHLTKEDRIRLIAEQLVEGVGLDHEMLGDGEDENDALPFFLSLLYTSPDLSKMSSEQVKGHLLMKIKAIKFADLGERQDVVRAITRLRLPDGAQSNH